MKIYLIAAVALGIFILESPSTSAQQWRRRTASISDSLYTASDNAPKFTGNIAYVEGSSAWFLGSLFLNYEFVFHENWSAKLGAGGGYAENIANGYGGLLTANYFYGGDHKFEVNAGICYAGIKEYQLSGEISAREWKITPAFGGGYRYQPAGAGMFFRAGISYYSFGGGAHLGIGWRL
ncbi:hypothetical protein MASR2M18_06560 [Ignavibacteria bacterium]|nr:hypothetical protein [Bacteroidota bacterium]MCZ2132437.1 hypothetical protein [Bacteroidota bacterium]